MSFIGPNENIAVTFKRYTEFGSRRINSVQNAIDGVKSSAESINCGFVYVFRKYNDGPLNKDGSIVAVREYVMPPPSDQPITIVLTELGKVRENFFVYSTVKLSEGNRLEIIRKDLSDRLLGANNKNSFCRVQYIPMVKPDLFSGKRSRTDIMISNTVNYNYFFDSPRNPDTAFKDVDFEIRDNRVQGATIYLHDWFGYLSSCKDEYQEKIKNYYTFFNTKVTLSNYNRHPYNMDLNFEEPSRNFNDRFTIGELLPLTETIDKIYNKKRGKYGGNLRMFREVSIHDEYNVVEYDGSVRKESVDYTGEVPAYRLFLQETEEQITIVRNELRPAIQRIICLLKDAAANAAFSDYLFSNNNNKKLLFDTLGLATENYFLTMHAEDRLSFSELLIMALAKSGEIADRLPVRDIDQLHRIAGENPVLVFIFSLPVLNILTDESTRFMETLLAYAKTLSLSKTVDLYALLSKGIFKDLRKSGEAFSISKKGLLRFKGSNFPRRNGKIDYAAIAEKWYGVMTGEVRLKTNNPTLELERIRYSRGYRRWGVKIAQFEEIDDVANLRKKGIITGADALLNRISIILVGFNTVYQLSLINECRSLTHAVPHGFNIASGMAALVSGHLKNIDKAAGSRWFGAAAFAFAGLESGFYAIRASQDNDYDSSFFHGSASLTYFGAVAATLAGAGTGPIMALAGLAFLFSSIANYLKDEAIDVFLKYCVWGLEYKEDWSNDNRLLSSWWPLKSMDITDIESNTYEIIVGDDDVRKRNAYKLYDDSDERNIRANIAVLNIVQQIPSYDLNTYLDTTLVNKSIPRQFVIELAAHDFELMKTIEVKVMQQTGVNRATNASIYGGARTLTIDPSSPANAGYFYKDPNPGEMVKLPPVAIELIDEIDEAQLMRVLVIPSLEFITRRLLGAPYTFPSNIFQAGNMVSETKPIKVEIAIKYILPSIPPVRMVKIHGR
jgi:hypothetical protein